MLNASMTRGRARRVNAYLSKDILDATQKNKLLKLYGYAITNYRRNYMQRTNNALSE